jgi:hypothetical protein
MPIPPSRARAIARDASVTVSIAAESMGTFRVMSLVSFERMSTSRGRISEKAGTRSTSSNVRPSMKFFTLEFVAMCKDREMRKVDG